MLVPRLDHPLLSPQVHDKPMTRLLRSGNHLMAFCGVQPVAFWAEAPSLARGASKWSKDKKRGGVALVRPTSPCLCQGSSLPPKNGCPGGHLTHGHSAQPTALPHAAVPLRVVAPATPSSGRVPLTSVPPLFSHPVDAAASQRWLGCYLLNAHNARSSLVLNATILHLGPGVKPAVSVSKRVGDACSWAEERGGSENTVQRHCCYSYNRA